MDNKTTTQKLISENFDIQPENRIFANCDKLLRPYDLKIYGLYTQRIEGCDLKLRFSAYAFEIIKKHLAEIEHGEFIYLDDNIRLMLSYHFESLVIFLRASLDMGISAYAIYFSGKSDLDSFSDFLKKVKSRTEWIPSLDFWEDIISKFESDLPHWTNWLMGSEDGVSIRDKSIHKGTIPIKTYIGENDKGRIVVDYNRNEIAELFPTCFFLFHETYELLQRVKIDILAAEFEYAKIERNK